jgi:hypothetical protein
MEKEKAVLMNFYMIQMMGWLIDVFFKLEGSTKTLKKNTIEFKSSFKWFNYTKNNLKIKTKIKKYTITIHGELWENHE